MREVLIVRFDLDPEVAEYMDSEGVGLDTALENLEMYPEEAVSTKLEIVDRDELGDCGIKGRDYMVIKKINKLEKYGYALEDVLEELNIDDKSLKSLGVTMDVYDEYDDD